ncbi:hypothetical protein [Desulfonatronum sp. SC1]|uniref:hypothetical protein n=1 Tax=Desulfonatronum sp. SC1 TaxID=2109626 RepID=UPI000D2F4E6F|nr:hypothetical protein [Desulfonatronum sp. SC1]PTN32584.1 hypothetical protein C6366_16320 [Desulfonatronum sp. SC1]
MPRISLSKIVRPNFSKLLSRLPMPGSLCLGVEYVEDEVRAALVRAKGREREIMEFVAVKAPEAEDDLPGIAQLQEIRNRLNCKQNIQTVFVTPLARLVVLPMNRERVLSMRSHLLAEAVKWEAETYTGVPGHLSLAGVEVEKPRDEPGQIREELEEIMVHVAVLEQNIYRAARERFRMAGLKLARVYPGEVCFHVPLLYQHEESDRGVLEIGAASSGFALLRGGSTLAINAMNVTAEMIRAHLDGRTMTDLEDSLRFNFGQAPGPLPVALTGVGAMDHRIVAFLRTLSPTGVEPVRLQRTSGLTTAGSEEGPMFATAAGAAMRELGGKGMQAIGISDAVPPAVRIRQSIYLMPLAAASFLFVVLLGHNLLMRYQESDLSEQRRDIEAQLSERKKVHDEVKRLEGDIQKVDERTRDLRRQMAYIKDEWDKPLQARIDMYDALIRNMPPTVALIGIRHDQRNPNIYVVSGEAVSPSAILDFALRLREEGGLSVDVQRLEPQQQVRGKGSASHRFVMHLEVGSGPKADQT